MNCIYFQFAMLAYNLNCWLMLFNPEEDAKVETLGHPRGHGAIEVPVPGSAHLASRRKSRHQL